jgi:uncharacterized damage-inducible protein DinB
MKYDLDHALDILARTPDTLKTWLGGLPEEWITSNEGENTWSPFDIVGHLAHGEETDWIARTKMILVHGEYKTFEPFDRFAQFKKFKGKSTEELLDLFGSLREKNLRTLREMDLKPSDFPLRAKHPDLGEVTLGQLLSTWVVHDLGHIGQIARVMSKQYSAEVGPWRAYLRVLKS